MRENIDQKNYGYGHFSRSGILISERAFQWKMNFNPDPTKQAEELIFCLRNEFPSVIFQSKSVVQGPFQKKFWNVFRY